jgi:hypothetical protein
MVPIRARLVWAGTARGASLVVFALLPAAFTVALFAAGGHAFAYDFHQAFWPAGQHVLHGQTPYVSPDSADVAQGVAFLYPAVATVLLAPFALLGRSTADYLFAIINVAAVLLTLLTLGVRDWRLYGFTLLCPPVVYAWHLANVTLPIVLGLAAVWRWRDRSLVSGALTALLVSVKLFVWPIGLWLLATRRYGAVARCLALGAALNVAAWAVVGFDQISRYEAVLRAATSLEEGRGCSAVALALHVGLDRVSAHVLALGLTGMGVALCWALGRAGRERHALGVAIGLCLLASPIVWLPYFALLVIPLALAHPRFHAAWCLMLPLWACPTIDPTGRELIVLLACTTALAAILVRSSRGWVVATAAQS